MYNGRDFSFDCPKYVDFDDQRTFELCDGDMDSYWRTRIAAERTMDRGAENDDNDGDTENQVPTDLSIDSMSDDSFRTPEKTIPPNDSRNDAYFTSESKCTYSLRSTTERNLITKGETPYRESGRRVSSYRKSRTRRRTPLISKQTVDSEDKENQDETLALNICKALFIDDGEQLKPNQAVEIESIPEVVIEIEKSLTIEEFENQILPANDENNINPPESCPEVEEIKTDETHLSSSHPQSETELDPETVAKPDLEPEPIDEPQLCPASEELPIQEAEPATLDSDKKVADDGDVTQSDESMDAVQLLSETDNSVDDSKDILIEAIDFTIKILSDTPRMITEAAGISPESDQQLGEATEALSEAIDFTIKVLSEHNASFRKLQEAPETETKSSIVEEVDEKIVTPPLEPVPELITEVEEMIHDVQKAEVETVEVKVDEKPRSLDRSSTFTQLPSIPDIVIEAFRDNETSIRKSGTYTRLMVEPMIVENQASQEQSEASSSSPKPDSIDVDGIKESAVVSEDNWTDLEDAQKENDNVSTKVKSSQVKRRSKNLTVSRVSSSKMAFKTPRNPPPRERLGTFKKCEHTCGNWTSVKGGNKDEVAHKKCRCWLTPGTAPQDRMRKLISFTTPFKVDRYKTLAELEKEFERTTRIYPHTPCDSKWTKKPPTQPKSPKLSAMKRIRQSHCTTHGEEEERLAEDIRKNGFKATPFNRKKFCVKNDSLLKRPNPIPSTIPKPFAFLIDKRIQNRKCNATLVEEKNVLTGGFEG